MACLVATRVLRRAAPRVAAAAANQLATATMAAASQSMLSSPAGGGMHGLLLLSAAMENLQFGCWRRLMAAPLTVQRVGMSSQASSPTSGADSSSSSSSSRAVAPLNFDDIDDKGAQQQQLQKTQPQPTRSGASSGGGGGGGSWVLPTLPASLPLQLPAAAGGSQQLSAAELHQQLLSLLVGNALRRLPASAVHPTPSITQLQQYDQLRMAAAGGGGGRGSGFRVRDDAAPLRAALLRRFLASRGAAAAARSVNLPKTVGRGLMLWVL